MAALRVSAPEPIPYCMPGVLCQEQAFRATAWQSAARNVGYGKLLLEVDRSQPSFSVLVYALFVRRHHSICTRSARAPSFPSRALHQAGAAPADSSVTLALSLIRGDAYAYACMQVPRGRRRAEAHIHQPSVQDACCGPSIACSQGTAAAGARAGLLCEVCPGACAWLLCKGRPSA